MAAFPTKLLTFFATFAGTVPLANQLPALLTTFCTCGVFIHPFNKVPIPHVIPPTAAPAARAATLVFPACNKDSPVCPPELSAENLIAPAGVKTVLSAIAETTCPTILPAVLQPSSYRPKYFKKSYAPPVIALATSNFAALDNIFCDQS